MKFRADEAYDAHQYDRFREIFAPDIQITIHNQGRTTKFGGLE